jgi:hypothetical protein
MDRHRRGLERIAEDPSLIGLSGVEYVELEIPVYRGDRLLTDIDLFFDTDSGLFIAEYKSGRRFRQERADRQLRIGKSWVRSEYGEDPRLLHVHGPRFVTYEVFL